MTTGETKYIGQGGVLCWKTLLGVPRRQVMYMPVTLGGKSSGCGEAQPGQRPKEPQSFRKPERQAPRQLPSNPTVRSSVPILQLRTFAQTLPSK